jgi:hypothetical protein
MLCYNTSTQQELDMLATYVDGYTAHTRRATAQGFKALRFDQFVSLAKHLQVAK